MFRWKRNSYPVAHLQSQASPGIIGIWTSSECTRWSTFLMVRFEKINKKRKSKLWIYLVPRPSHSNPKPPRPFTERKICHWIRFENILSFNVFFPGFWPRLISRLTWDESISRVVGQLMKMEGLKWTLWQNGAEVTKNYDVLSSLSVNCSWWTERIDWSSSRNSSHVLIPMRWTSTQLIGGWKWKENGGEIR